MESILNLAIALACAGHFFQAVCAFPSGNTGSSSRTRTNRNNNNNHITIDLPLSPSVQSPTLMAYIDDNNQFQTLYSNQHNLAGDSTRDNANALSSENDRTASGRRIGYNNVQTVGRHQVVNEGRFDMLNTMTNQASLPTRPTIVHHDSFKDLLRAIQRRRDRARRIQSFRRAILHQTGRTLVGERIPNMAQARRLALQSLRNRIRA